MKKITLLAAVLVPLLMAVTIASAQSRPNAADSVTDVNSDRARQQRQQRLERDEQTNSMINAERAQAQIERQARLKERCERTTGVMSGYQNRHQQNSRQYIEAFRRVEANLESIAERLGTSEIVDVTQLVALISQLSTMIDEFEVSNSDFIATIQEIPTTACSGGDQDLRVVIQSSQTAFRQLKAEAGQIRSFIQNTIRPELIRLREQLAQSDSE
ncbi:MAG: hypothetical protein WDZ94_02385 [Patescibacteria group bacterium]